MQLTRMQTSLEWLDYIVEEAKKKVSEGVREKMENFPRIGQRAKLKNG
jgi:hypothetical protein